IQSTQNITIPVNSPGLVAYYKLDEGLGNTTVNSANVSVSPTVINGPVWAVPSSCPLNSPYLTSYLWSNNATTPTINVTTTGNYSVSVTDNDGCVGTSAPVTVTGCNNCNL